MMIDTEQDVIY